MTSDKMLSQHKAFWSKFLCFFVFFSIFAAHTPMANAADIFLKARIKHFPIWSTVSAKVDFEPDEALCKKSYGNNWKNKCSAWLGKPGTVAKGVIAKDWPKGEWIWATSSQLRFTPSESWKSSTKYIADVKNVTLPSRVKLTKTSDYFITLPRAAEMGTTKIWIDPSPKAEHAISFAMRFNESINAEARKTIESRATITPNKNSGLKLGKGQWVWFDDNTRAVVNSRILSMPKKKSTAKLTVPGVRPLFYQNKSWQYPDKTATKDLVVPGTDSLFKLEEVELEQWQNKALQMEQHIVFRFSQRVPAEDLLKALTILELPLQRDKENILPSDWKQGKISPQNKQQARKLEAQLVKLPDENEDFLRFRINTTPGHYILWNIAAGFGPTNAKGIKTPLERSVEGLELVSKGEARLDLLQAGNVLAMNSDLALVSENVDKITWTASRFKDESLALPFITSLDYTLDDSEAFANSVVTRGNIIVAEKASKAGSFTSSPVFNTLSSQKVFSTEKGDIKPGLIFLRLEGEKKGKRVVDTTRIIMYSNMAMVLKKLPSGGMEAYVCSMDKAEPLENVRVQVLGYNSIPVAEMKTDAYGKAVFPNMSHLQNEKKPTAVVARNASGGENADILWMSMEDYERNVNLSDFSDIGGSQSSTNSLNAFVFTERGYFRPGEQLRFGALLRSNDWKLLPKDMPLLAIVNDEVGRKVFQQAFKAGDSIHSFTWDIPESAMTGRYSLSIATPSDTNKDKEGLILGTAYTKVEMFLPDTLRIRTALVDAKNTQADAPPLSTKGWIVTSDKPGSTALRVKLDTLFGQVAADRRITASMRLYPAHLSFSGYEDFTFQDMSPFFAKGSDPINRDLQPTVSDKKGLATLPLDFTQWRFGTLQCSIYTQGFEPGGGRAVSQEKRFLLSPLPYMIGYKAGEGADNRNFIMKDSTAKLQFQAIDPEVKPVNPGKLLFSIARRSSVTSLVSDSQGQYTYAETPVDTTISQGEQEMTAEGTLLWDVPTKEVGDFVLTVKMPAATAGAKETVLAHVPFSIVGNDDLRPALKSLQSLPKAHLHIKTDKNNYSGGEMAKIMLTAPYDGVALISLERDTVVSHKWVKVNVGNSMHELEIPDNFSGRGYIQVLMGRAPESNSIFLQPQSVALAAITVNTARHLQELEITAPEKALPGKTLSWKIKNTQGKPTKAVLFAVDEGILQLSRYKTPNPLNYLLLDRALEVNTSQLFDRLMAGDKKIMQRVSAYGGDGGENDFAAMLGTFQNPFKRKNEPPMTWWSGVVDIPAEGLDLEIPIPDYFNGSLRLMAVVNNTETVGNGQARVIIQDTQVLTPQVPVMASLGDSFQGGFAIANTTDAPITLKLNLALDQASAAKGMNFSDFPESVSLAAKEEKLIPFTAKTGKEPGEAILVFTTDDGAGTVKTRKTSMSIRPEVLPRFTQQTLIINQSTDLFSKRTLLPYDAKTSIALSPMPLPLLQSALSYLEYYPYNCVEQTLSKAYPLASLVNSPLGQELSKSLPFLNTKNIEKTFKRTQGALLTAFDSYYGMSLWEDRSEHNLFLTAYAADYVLALRDAQLPLPPGLMPQLFNTLERNINESPNTVEELRTLAYATWVLARAGYVVSKQLELFEAFIKENELDKSDIYHSLMAGSYASLYMEKEANRHLRMVIGKQAQSWEDDDGGMFDVLAQYGLHAQVLARHFPEEFQQSIAFLQASFLEGTNKPHATLGASMAARGLMEIIKNGTKSSMDGVQLLCNNYSDGAKPSTGPIAQMFDNLHMLNAPACSSFGVRLAKEQKLYAQIQEYGYDTKAPTKALEQGILVRRSYTKSDGTALGASIVQGEVLRVDLEVSLSDKNGAPVVVVDLLPGGFELVLDHDDDTGPSSELSLRRDEDRIIAFLNAGTGAYTITYHIRAISQGDFAMPLAQAEGLFDRNLQGHTAGGKRVKVTNP